MTNVLLGGLCVGQVFIALVLLGIYGKFDHISKRMDKILLTGQELADRLWEAKPG